MKVAHMLPLLTVVVACGPSRIGIHPAILAPPTVVPGTLDASVLLHDASTRANDAGAGPLAIVAAGESSERERIGAFVEVPEGACLLGYGRASRSVEDLDLAAFSDDGTPVAVDDAPDNHPTLLVCPPHPNRVYLAAVVASGEGLVAVGAQLVPATLAGTIGKTMSAHGTRAGGSRAAEAWPGLDDLVRKHHLAEGGEWEVLRKVAVAVDARVPAVVALPLEADSCSDVLVVPDDDVGALEVEALDDGGRLIARGTARDRTRSLTICSPIAWTGSVSLRPHAGQGLVAVVVSRGRGETMKALQSAPDVAWSAAKEPIAVARTMRDGELRKAGYGAAIGSLAVDLAVGRSHSVAPNVGDPRACTRFDIVGGAATALVDATVWDDAGRLIAHADGASSATVFSCGTSTPRLQVEARARPGPAAVTWRAEPWNDRSFATHPVAASRMLTRLASGTPALLPGNLEGAHIRAVQIEAGHDASWSEVLEPGVCVRVGAGAAGEGIGLTGRIVDLATGDELDRSHGANTVMLEACAPPTSMRTLALTLVATAGKLDVVVGERTLR